MIAGFPVVDVKVVVFDGKEHPVDSKDIAFQIAGREGFKIAFRDAGAALDGTDYGCPDHRSRVDDG